MAQRRRALMTGVRSVTRIVAIAAVPLLLMLLPASAQYISGMRGPNMVTGPRMPNINPGVTLNPSVHYSPNVTVDGAAASPPHLKSGDDDTPGSGSGRRGKKKPGPNLSGDPFVAREVVTESDGVVSDEQAAAIARRHRITRLESFSVPLVGSTLTRWRIPDARSVGAVVRELVADNTIKSVQPNFRFTLQDGPGASEGDPAQYALAQLRLPEAHVLTRGEDVAIAVIDSGIDYAHPEFAGSISATFDVLASKEGAHPHGTGIAGVIVSHARLMGGAPAAKILAIRAFGVADKTVESTSFAILRSLDFAIARGARIVNMSFAGPQDPLLAKGLAAAAAKGIVLVAASGNAGPKSPPLFPAADRHVIAVSAVDAGNGIFAASNRGSHVAICAPGVDILTAAPDGKYQVASGTSFAAAYVSAVAALIVARNPALAAEEVRDVLTRTVHDLGPPGRDDQFGAGELDALAAVTAAAAPIETASDRAGASNVADPPRAR
jgi:hypothetical protein